MAKARANILLTEEEDDLSDLSDLGSDDCPADSLPIVIVLVVIAVAVAVAVAVTAVVAVVVAVAVAVAVAVTDALQDITFFLHF